MGPEGGFSNSEKELIIKSKNVLSVSLGNRLLRSDTAITVALFCVQVIVDRIICFTLIMFLIYI